MEKTDICPICEEGNLKHIVEQNITEYKGIEAPVALHYSECDACGSEQANAVDVRNNKRAMQAFRKTVDGLLTGAEICATRKYLEINQQQAANIFGGGKVAFSKYENDDVNQSDAMDRLIRVAKAVPAAFKWLAKNAGEDAVADKVLQKMFAKTEMKSDSIHASFEVLERLNKKAHFPKASASETVISCSFFENSSAFSDYSLEGQLG
jgi:HTH-type transcriptional regulator/antitoxin MqsA